jgi:hypothetical protein
LITRIRLVVAATVVAAGLGTFAVSTPAALAQSESHVPGGCTFFPLSIIKADLGGKPTGPTYVKGVCMFGTLDLRYGSATYAATVKAMSADRAESLKGIGVDSWGFTEDQVEYIEMWQEGVTATIWSTSATRDKLAALSKTFAKLLWDR